MRLDVEKGSIIHNVVLTRKRYEKNNTHKKETKYIKILIPAIFFFKSKTYIYMHQERSTKVQNNPKLPNLIKQC